MKKAWIGAVAAGLLATACSSGTTNNQTVANDLAQPGDIVVPADETALNEEAMVGNDAEPDNALATVLGMTESQRNIPFVRAIMDSGFRCDGVTKSERVDDYQGQPAWRATCKDGTLHLLTVKPDGTVNIISRTDK